MPTGPFADFTNALLTFQVSSAGLVPDKHGFLRPGVATIQVEAQLDQNSKPKVERRPGVDTSAIFLEGPLTGVIGAAEGEELILPSVVTPESPCSIEWAGRRGEFHLEFTAPDSILESLGIYELTEIRGWFVPSSFVVSGEPWTPPAPPPIAGDVLYSAEYPAAATLSALRVVAVDAGALVYADSANPDHAFKVLGLLSAAVSSGSKAQAITEGAWTDPSWNWDPSIPIWLGANGTLTQTPPESGFLLQVATASSPQTIEFEIQEVILL